MPIVRSISSFGTIELWQNRTTDYQFATYQENKTTGVAVASDDVFRAKLGDVNGVAPDLDIDSNAATANGSIITVDQITAPATFTVRFAQGDLSGLAAGEYFLELLLVDNSETAPVDAIKVISTGTVQLYGTQLGDIGVA